MIKQGKTESQLSKSGQTNDKKKKTKIDYEVIFAAVAIVAVCSVITFALAKNASKREKEVYIRRMKQANSEGIVDCGSMTSDEKKSFKLRLTSEVDKGIQILKTLKEDVYKSIDPMGDAFYHVVDSSVSVKTRTLNTDWDCGVFGLSQDEAPYEESRSYTTSGALAVDAYLKGGYLSPIDSLDAAIRTIPVILDDRYFDNSTNDNKGSNS